MIEKIYLVTDLGPGDGGKGGVVHKLANTFRASLVIKFGGGQGSHGVISNGGEEFAFSQWGCGTLEAIPTVIAPSFIVIPHAILNEGKALQKLGINNPYKLLTVDSRALVATPIHRIASQLHELMRKDQPRGTVGTGAGEAHRLKQKLGGCLNLYVRDLHHTDKVRQVLTKVVNYYQQEFKGLLIECDFLPEDQENARGLLKLLRDPGYLDWTIDEYQKFMTSGVTISTLDYALGRHDGIAVAECSHGVLTDAERGFWPHVSAIRTLPNFATTTLIDAGFSGKIVRLGVTRAYAVRHGAGPLPTTDHELRKRLLPHSHKDTNRWQGDVRVGALDFNLLRYAIESCGGSSAFDGLCVTCFDQVVSDGVWRICDKYKLTNGDTYTIAHNFVEQVADGKIIPQLKTFDFRHLSHDKMIETCCETFLQQLGIPVRLISLGPSDQNKILL